VKLPPWESELHAQRDIDIDNLNIVELREELRGMHDFASDLCSLVRDILADQRRGRPLH
jgi:hypothetical protein